MEKKFKPGDRVRLIRDLLEETTVHPVNLYTGDEGLVVEHPTQRGLLGFLSDRWGDITSFNKRIDGETQLVLNFCELVEASPTVAISSIPSSVDEPKDNGFTAHIGSISSGPEAEKKFAEEIAKRMARPKPRYEIKTLLQDISEDREVDNSLSQLLNDGWEILELSHHVVDELDGETIIREFRRVVTLRRAAPEEKQRATGGFVTAGVPYMVGGDNAGNERFVMAVDSGQNNGIMGGQWFIIDKDGKAIPSSKPDENGIAYPLDPTSQKPHFTLSPTAEIKLNTPSLKAIADELFRELDETDGEDG